MPVPKTGRGSGLIPSDISKRPDHLELSKKGGKAKSKAKTLANRLKGMKVATNRKRLAFYAELMADPEMDNLELLRLWHTLFEGVEKEHNAVQMFSHRIALHKAIHGEKIKTENIHHVVDWTQAMKDILEDEPTETETGNT